MSWVRERRLRKAVRLPPQANSVEMIVGVVGCAVYAALVLLWLLAVFSLPRSKGHDWYPVECCSGHDCAALDPARVQPLSAGGFMVDGSFYVPRSQVRDSMDGRYHGCFPKPDNLRCFFAPPRGV